MLRTQNVVRISLLRHSSGGGFFPERTMSAAASPPVKRPKLNPRDEARVRDLSQRVITALAQGDRRPHMKRSERDRRGMAEENRLREVVENPDSYLPPPPITNTPELSVPSYGMEFTDNSSLPGIPKYVYSDAMMDIQPGYLLECQKSGRSTIGVVLGFEQRYRSLHILCISANGGVFSCRNTDVSFSYPSFVSSDVISRAGLGEIPTSYVETAARIQIVKRIRQIERAVQIAMLRIVKRGSALYGMFKDPDPHKWGIMTLVDALRATFGRKADLQLHHALAMKEYLLAQSTPFIIQTFDMLRSRTYFVRPLAALENLQQVAEWIRNNDESIERFVRMASLS
ncbi:hypothetical protein BS47DRAFT_1133975 [Hydnum rufescens UP504]|uniref:Uncharacterized protein n=1 Tax=Hydnum rufescens UP504 TaxID=1448309 RepID=A0A9P6ATU9_9AGAM|nr:hypothetical protein BS47DRAFT_1133975 [Hydnum rufescens UP504]